RSGVRCAASNPNRRHLFRLWWSLAVLLTGGAGDDDVGRAIDARAELGVQRHRRTELLDDRGPRDLVTGQQLLAPVDRGVDEAAGGVEADGTVTGLCPLVEGGRTVGRGDVASLRSRDRSDAGDSQIHPFDELVVCVGEVVAIELAVL